MKKPLGTCPKGFTNVSMLVGGRRNSSLPMRNRHLLRHSYCVRVLNCSTFTQWRIPTQWCLVVQSGLVPTAWTVPTRKVKLNQSESSKFVRKRRKCSESGWTSALLCPNEKASWNLSKRLYKCVYVGRSATEVVVTLSEPSLLRSHRVVKPCWVI